MPFFAMLPSAAFSLTKSIASLSLQEKKVKRGGKEMSANAMNKKEAPKLLAL
jgi:hypothetical protein